MSNPTCLICGTSTQEVGPYLFCIDYDKKYLGKPSIYRCDHCDFAFAHPMPSTESLNDYYSNVYYAEGRPHYINTQYLPQPVDRHHNHLGLLTQELNLNKVQNVLEIGAGAGEIGLLLKKHFPHINIYCIEPEPKNKKILGQRGYQIIENSKEIEQPVDLILSFHCLEHFTHPTDFMEICNQSIRQNGHLYLEIPNCPFEEGFDSRPYDSPHLLFFTKKSLLNLVHTFGYREKNHFTYGYPLELEFKMCTTLKKQYENWTPENPNLPVNLYQFAKKHFPKKIFKTLDFYLGFQDVPEKAINKNEYNYLNHNDQGWVLKGLFQKVSSMAD